MFFQLMSDSVVELSSEPEASVEPESENLCVADNTQWNILKRPANEIYKFSCVSSEMDGKHNDGSVQSVKLLLRPITTEPVQCTITEDVATLCFRRKTSQISRNCRFVQSLESTSSMKMLRVSFTRIIFLYTGWSSQKLCSISIADWGLPGFHSIL